MSEKEKALALEAPPSLPSADRLIRGWLESPNGVAWRWTLGRKSGLVKYSGTFCRNQGLRVR